MPRNGRSRVTATGRKRTFGKGPLRRPVSSRQSDNSANLCDVLCVLDCLAQDSARSVFEDTFYDLQTLPNPGVLRGRRLEHILYRLDFVYQFLDIGASWGYAGQITF